MQSEFSENPPVQATQTMPREDQLEVAHKDRPTEETLDAELDALEDDRNSDHG